MELLKLLLQITSVAMEIHQLAFACKFQHIISLPRIAKNIVKKCNKNKMQKEHRWLDEHPNGWHGHQSVKTAYVTKNSSFITDVTRVSPTKLVVNVTDKFKRQKKKIYSDRTTKDLSELKIGQPVRMRSTTAQGKKWTYGTCVDTIGKRSYSVEVNNRQYRRNLRDLRLQRNP